MESNKEDNVYQLICIFGEDNKKEKTEEQKKMGRNRQNTF